MATTCTLLMMWIALLLCSANAQDGGNNATLFGTWGVEQFNYSCDADASGKRMVGHRPIDFNTVSFTNWNGVFKAWTVDWAIMSGTYFPNGSFVAQGKVGVNVNDTSAIGCALTSRINGRFNESDDSWEAILQLEYSMLCWGCLVDESGLPYVRTVPLRSSRYLSAPKVPDPPVTLTPPDYLQGLMVEWPVSANGQCGIFKLGVTAVKFMNVNFSSIALTASTSLGKLPLRGRYQLSNDTFSASASFPFTLGGQCSAIVQVTGQVQFAENSSCAEEHNVSLAWSANVTMRVFGGCAQCTQLQFPLAPFDCSESNQTNNNSASNNETNSSSSSAPSLSPPPPPTPFDIITGMDTRGVMMGEGYSFIPNMPLWGACLIVVAIFVCCVLCCVLLFLGPWHLASKKQRPAQPVAVEEEKLVEHTV